MVSPARVPIKLYLQWINEIAKIENYTRRWIPSTMIYFLFCKMKNIKGLRESTFMYKMNSICSSNFFVYKKRVYNVNTNGYQNWFLFVNNSKLIENVEDVFTVQIESNQVQNTFLIKSSQVQKANQIESTQVQNTDQHQMEYDSQSQTLIQALSPASTPASTPMPTVISPASFFPVVLFPATPASSSPSTPASLFVATPASSSPSTPASSSLATPASSSPSTPASSSPVTPASSSPASLSPSSLSLPDRNTTTYQQDQFKTQTYFNSKEARNIFGYSKPKSDEEKNIDVRDIIYDRIVLFQGASYTHSGWKSVMEDSDVNNKCGLKFIDNIRTKSKYLYHSLTIFLERKETDLTMTWKNACELAVKKIKEFEGSHNEVNENGTHHFAPVTIMKWFRQYRDNPESFINSPYRSSLIEKYPPVFNCNPNLKEKCIAYAKTNLIGLTGEVMFDFFHHTIIPELIKEEKDETGEEMTKVEILKQYGIHGLCLNTIYNWMSMFGFKYSPIKKTYYVDGHERPETVAYRKQYCSKYLHNEIRCHRWIQLTSEELEKLEEERIDFVRDNAYVYFDNERALTMYEFHVDDLNNQHEKLTNVEFGGFLSVRKKENERPIIMIGQDECIFKQFLIVRKQWVLPDGTAALNPKDEGMGIMLSSFCSRDFGYGFKLNPLQLAIVNRYREGKDYLDENASMEVLKTKTKPPLKDSPFVRKFQYGLNYDGYWNYHHMVIQFEDVVDVLKALYGDTYHFLFFFDHSSGHDKMRPNGLNSNNMNKYFGGEQNKMRKSEIKNESYLGPYSHDSKLKVGETQSMQYEATDNGPFYLSQEKRLEQMYDRELNEIEKKKYTRAQLIDMIKEKTTLPNIRGTLKEIQQLATDNAILLEYERRKMQEGWMHKPKGSLQILWERGFIDPETSVRDYAVNGKKVNKTDKSIIPGSSLKELIESLPDFNEELTLLQFRGKQLGVEICCSPKYHPEIAGESIEFCWAFNKNTYRRYSLKDKRTKAKFIELVNECQEGLTNELVRVFGRRLRRYILAYHAIEKAKEDADIALQSDEGSSNNFYLPAMSCSLVERLVRKRRSHRNIADQEKSFLTFAFSVMRETSKNLN